MTGIEIWRFEDTCWKYGTTNQVVYPTGLGGFGGGTWGRVGDQLAEKSYCNVERTYSKTQGREVYGNVCTDCGAYQGNHFIHEAVFDTVAAFQSWGRAREEYDVVDVIDISCPCTDCGRELTHMATPQLCEECAFQREVDELEGVAVELEYCEICDGILHPEHRAQHHTSYDPEETILVCDTCHAKIHHRVGFHDELQPEMSRSEADQRGLLSGASRLGRGEKRMHPYMTGLSDTGKQRTSARAATTAATSLGRVDGCSSAGGQ